MQNRYKSKVAWTSVVALLFFVLKNYGLLDNIGLDESSFNELATLIFSVLVGFGIFNNPTDDKKY